MLYFLSVLFIQYNLLSKEDEPTAYLRIFLMDRSIDKDWDLDKNKLSKQLSLYDE